MNPDSARKLVDIAGFSVVVVSVLLLAYQVQRGNEIAEVTTTNEIVANFSEFNITAASDERLTNLFVGLAADDFEPTEEQAVAASFLAFTYMNLLITFERAYQNGLIDDIQLSIAVQDAEDVLGEFPGWRPYFESILASHPAYLDYEVIQAMTTPASR